MKRIHFRCAKEVAFDSPDHLMPHGTARDNSKHWLFNAKLNALLPEKPLNILDIGCSGGGFVKSCVEQGHNAFGIEGSDYSRKHKRAEWATIPERLFTCDATAEFSFFVVDTSGGEAPVRFNVITAWEFIEHISKGQLHAVCSNVKRNLAPGGLWIMSVSPNEDIVNGVRLHQTVENQEWWASFFESEGFVNHPELVDYFGYDWVRGPLRNAPHSFHVVLTLSRDPAPSPPRTKEVIVLSCLSATVSMLLRARMALKTVVGGAVRSLGLR